MVVLRCLCVVFFGNKNSCRIFVTMKLTDDSLYIGSLISQGEHIEQDFKYEISDARKIARTLSAFANTQGGRLLVGVKDNGRIAGVRCEEEMYMVEAAARLYCVPEVEVSMRVYRVEGRIVLLVDVPQVQCRPVMAVDEENRRWAYVRVADENILATAVHLQVWRDSDVVLPDVLSFTEREHRVLALLAREEECSIGRVCRVMGVSWGVIVQLLARFVRWGIVAMRYNGKQFVFRASD